MQKTVAEILHIELYGNFISLESPNFGYDKLYGCISGSPTYKLGIGIGSALMSRRCDYIMTIPIHNSLDSCPTFIWFENVTRSYWR